MLAVDTNILVYAHRREARVGDDAHALLAGLAEGERPWAIPWPCCSARAPSPATAPPPKHRHILSFAPVAPGRRLRT